MERYKCIASTLLFLGMTIMSFSQPTPLIDPGVSPFEKAATSASSIVTVTTQAVSNIMTTTAIGNGSIIDLGDTNSVAHGVCWSTVGTPTLADDVVDNGVVPELGTFEAELTDLIPHTKYYVRAYAINSVDTVYGEEVVFTTDIVSGVNEIFSEKVEVYPNPFRDNIHLTNTKDIVNVRICALSGATVLDTKNTDNFDLSYLSKGVYFVKCEKNNFQVEILKIIKE